MAEKISSRVVNEAKYQIDSIANSAIQNKFGGFPRNGYPYPPNVCNADFEVCKELIDEKNYSLYGKLAAYGNGNASYAVQCLATNQTIYGNMVGSDITDSEKKTIKELYKEKADNSKKIQDERLTFKSTVDEMASAAKLDIAAATSLEQIKTTVAKFKTGIDSLS